MTETGTDRFDCLLEDNGPAALVFHRTLLPVEGKDAWIFPPTFAQSESAEDEEESSGGDYQIDDLPDNPKRNVCLIDSWIASKIRMSMSMDNPKRNVCLIDSVGSQANRMEPVFKQEPYAALVPQQVVTMKGEDTVNILDAGHRAADAALRFSKTLGPKLWSAFDLYKRQHDCSGLARLAPTSLIFGVWDSRATGVKIQRVVRSVIRAYDVRRANRKATYQAAYDYTGNDVINSELDKGIGKKNPLSQEGFKYSLASGHGGIIVNGEIRQEAIINLVAIRTLTTNVCLRRYLLGLSLVALSYRDERCFNLREGCLLCAASKDDYDGRWLRKNFDGTEDRVPITHDDALAFAKVSAQDVTFDLPEPNEFDKETAEAWLKIEKKKRKALAKKKHPAKAVADEIAAAQKKKANDKGKDKNRTSDAAPESEAPQ